MTDIPLVLEPESPGDADAIERLNERVFGPGRFARTAYRIREAATPEPSLSFVARVGTLLVGANAMTPISVGGTPAMLLGPLIVEPVFRSQGIGEALVSDPSSPPGSSASAWCCLSATSLTMRAWVSSGVRPAGSRCPAPWIWRACFIAN